MLDETPALADEQDTCPQRRQAPAPWLFCASCGNRISRVSDALSFGAGHEHRFVNPAQVPSRIVLYTRAPGCRRAGDFTGYFSWFPGYGSRLALCGGCGEHLGWTFSCFGTPGQGKPAAFHGLVRQRIHGPRGRSR